MIKTLSAIALAAFVATTLAIVPGFTPKVEASVPQALAKGDRLDIRPIGKDCSQQAWPNFEYRTTGRGGKGIVAMSVNNRNGKLVASFPVEHADQIMLVTDKGQLIRCPVEDIRIAGRSTQGVIVFNTADDEHVVSVEHIGEETDGAANGNGGAASGEATGGD